MRVFPVRSSRSASFLSLLVLATILLGCSSLWPSYYDPSTYRSLTTLKPKVALLYKSLTLDKLNDEKVAEVRLELDQIYEYEKGKGDSNRETAKQVESIREMFEQHLADRQKEGKWSEAHMRNNLENIGDAFDIAIKTERLKNKNE